MTAALRNAGLRRLAGFYALNALLEWFGSVALMVVVYGATKSAAVTAALLLTKQVVPGLLLPAASQITTRFGRSALPLAFAAHGLALAVVIVAGFGAGLFLAALASGVAAGLVRGLLRSAVATGFVGDELRAANGLLNLVLGVAAPVAPVLAAGSIALGGADLALGIAAVGLLVAAAFAPRVAGDDLAGEPTDAAESTLASVGSTSSVPVPWLLLLAGAVTCVSVIDEPSLLAFSQLGLNAGVGGYGAIFAAQACGVAFGGLLFGRLLAWPMMRVYAMAAVLTGLGLIGMGFSPSIEIACAFAVLVGVGTGLDWVAIVTAVQEATPRGLQRQVNARLEAAGMIGPGVGLLLGALVAEIGSVRAALVVPGVLAIGILVFGVFAVAWARSARASAKTVSFSTSIPGGPA